MRKLLILMAMSFLMLGCSKKESRLDKIEAEQELHKHQKDRQASESQEIGVSEHNSVPQRGFDALKDIKEVRSEEEARQEEVTELIQDTDNE